MAQIHELAIVHDVQGVDCLVTHTFWDPADFYSPSAMATLWQGDPHDAFLDCLTDPDGLKAISASVIATDGGTPPAPIIVDSVEAGTRTDPGSEHLPPYVCQTHTLRTQLGGRRHRGRNFWSGGLETDIAPTGFVGTGGKFSDLVNTYYTALMGVFDGSPGPAWVVFSRKAYLTQPIAECFAAVTSQVGRQLVHTLRSRRT